VLLPGLDGTGELFRPLLAELPDWIHPVVVSYPRDRELGYAELLPLAAGALPTDAPFVILGESFSGPLAAMLAATTPPGLAGVVLCATFVRKPFRTLPAWLGVLCVGPIFRLWPAVLRLRSLPIRGELRGLLPLALAAIRSVRPAVVASRVRALLKVDVRAQVRALPYPLLYLQALRDTLIRKHNAEEIARIRPDMSLVQIDTRHFLLQLEPQRAAAAIAAFVEALSAAGSPLTPGSRDRAPCSG
jgi:pimeloyl-ACP methyl ester carboxylesterase